MMMYTVLLAFLSFLLFEVLNCSENVLNSGYQDSNNLLKGHPDVQLIISLPLLPQLTANESVPIFITTTDIYYRGNPATTYFNCTSGSFHVESLVDELSSFFIDPFIQGECTAFANSTNIRLHQSNTKNYNISTPMNITVLTDMPFHAGQDVSLIVMVSNEEEVPVTLAAVCGTSTIITYTQEILTQQLTGFTFPSNFTGYNCYFETITVPDFYNNIIPYPFTMVPLLTFSSPTNGTNYTTGNPIEAVISASNGLYPVVTLNLNCSGTYVISATQSIKNEFSLVPPSNAFGDCFLYMSEVEGYDISSPLNININRQLVIISPAQNQIIYTGEGYSILVEAAGGGELDTVFVDFSCEIGGTFTKDPIVGAPTGYAMNSYSQGPCIVNAYSNVPYYLNASVTDITILSILTSVIPIPAIVVAGDTVQVEIDSLFNSVVPVVITTTCYSKIDSTVIDSNTYSSYTLPITFTGVPCFMSFTALQYFVNITNVPVIVAMTSQQISEFTKLITFVPSNENN